MAEQYRIKGKIIDSRGTPVPEIKVKVYDNNGVFISDTVTDKKGMLDFECVVTPKSIKLVRDNRIVAVKDIADIMTDGILDLGDIVICMIPPAEWHLKGVITDKMSGEPLQGLTVELWDVDTSISGGPYYDPLGEGITDTTGKFSVWFDGMVFEREATWTGEQYPDVLIKVKNASGVVIHETEVDENVLGSAHICLPYCTHKGKEYAIEIDYVTVNINRVGPVDISDINASGLASYLGINGRPFGGNTTISGRIWGAKVDKWKLYYAEGFIDSGDSRLTGLGPSSPDPSGFTMIAQGTNKVWDGPVYKWNTSSLEGTYTAILVVWDQDGNEYHDNRTVFLHNTIITPPAQITFPAPGNTLSKSEITSVDIQGTASDDYFWAFVLHWAGPTQTELTGSGIAYPAAGNYTPVVSNVLGEWDITSKPEGPYVVRLAVHDRTILNDGGDTRTDWTWNTLYITA
ncbi:MAG: hypothetical protein KJ737_12315 [Proteobacteria bacterium]|nr:hypothetical protein [Pseudomonadota bacterium]